MGISVNFVKNMNGAPFCCHINQYMRTVVYKIPIYFIQGGHFPPCVIKETKDFKATIVTDPVGYTIAERFSDQSVVDVSFGSALSEKCKRASNKPEESIFIVFQFKEDIDSFPAVHGQCIKVESEGEQRILIFDCIDAPAPESEERTLTVNIVLTALKAELEITAGFKKIFDSSCFKTDRDECVIPMRVDSSARVTYSSPLSFTDLRVKSEASRILVRKIEKSIMQGTSASRQLEVSEFGTRLAELIQALQLDPSPDSAYLRLWYLVLWDRVDKFRESFGPRRPKRLNNNTLREEREHRNEIAHRGVDNVDGQMVRSLQEKALLYLKAHL